MSLHKEQRRKKNQNIY